MVGTRAAELPALALRILAVAELALQARSLRSVGVAVLDCFGRSAAHALTFGLAVDAVLANSSFADLAPLSLDKHCPPIAVNVNQAKTKDAITVDFIRE